MAITFIGSGVGTHAATSAQTYNFSSLLNAAGAAPTLAEGDLVITSICNATAGVNRGAGALVPATYTAAHTALFQTDTHATNFQLSYRFMTASPNTSVAIPASNLTTAGVAYAVHVFRGVDSVVHDVTATTAVAGNGAQPNPPAITPSSAGAWPFIAAGGAMAVGTAFQSTAPTGLSTGTNAWRQTVITSTTNDAAVAAGYKSDWTSGAVDIAQLTGGTSTNTGSWASVALVLRPLLLRRITSRSSYFFT